MYTSKKCTHWEKLEYHAKQYRKFHFRFKEATKKLLSEFDDNKQSTSDSRGGNLFKNLLIINYYRIYIVVKIVTEILKEFLIIF